MASQEWELLLKDPTAQGLKTVKDLVQPSGPEQERKSATEEARKSVLAPLQSVLEPKTWSELEPKL